MTTTLRALLVITIAFGVSARLRADTHTFVPTAFYNTYSFAHPPALRIKPGEECQLPEVQAQFHCLPGRYPLRPPPKH